MQPRRMMMLMTTTTTRKTTRMTSTRSRDRNRDGAQRYTQHCGLCVAWGTGRRWDEVAGVINNRQVAHALEHNYPLQRHRQVRVCVGVCLCVRAKKSARKGSARRDRGKGRGTVHGIASTWSQAVCAYFNSHRKNFTRQFRSYDVHARGRARRRGVAVLGAVCVCVPVCVLWIGSVANNCDQTMLKL